ERRVFTKSITDPSHTNRPLVDNPYSDRSLVFIEVKEVSGGWLVQISYAVSDVAGLGLNSRESVDYASELTTQGYTNECIGRKYGCTENVGQQIVIWHEVDDGDPLADLQTTYYHVDVKNV